MNMINLIKVILFFCYNINLCSPITGGYYVNDRDMGNYCYMVGVFLHDGIKNQTKLVCSAGIVNNTMVITSRGCLEKLEKGRYNQPPNRAFISSGSATLNVTDNPFIVNRNIINHFVCGGDSRFHSFVYIAILQLNETLPYSQYICPLQFPEIFDYTNIEAVEISGYGSTLKQTSWHSLKVVEMNIIRFEDCNATFWADRKTILTTNHFCYGGQRRYTDEEDEGGKFFNLFLVLLFITHTVVLCSILKKKKNYKFIFEKSWLTNLNSRVIVKYHVNMKRTFKSS